MERVSPLLPMFWGLVCVQQQQHQQQLIAGWQCRACVLLVVVPVLRLTAASCEVAILFVTPLVVWFAFVCFCWAANGREWHALLQ
jgi:hypothetical protein